MKPESKYGKAFAFASAVFGGRAIGLSANMPSGLRYFACGLRRRNTRKRCISGGNPK